MGWLPYAFRDIVIDPVGRWSGVIDLIDDKWVYIVHAQASARHRKRTGRFKGIRLDRERFDRDVRNGRYVIVPCA
ncbi:hypothetical protein GCM10025857_14960 [Alicyclobacillus contaminans]|uniref:hypothetical protein n=1 Tax=Alicyclobacillus contaminans TaxID=392016 RepID=UPI00040BBF38|nr:hypothetical protein [Alicyclobacillus contaminans]GMA50139.1 hypothetical protein GCM10025857_14960 [Alicyclobacillus contaminans]